jgi:glycosyltransferase involved in cell wall biosynthesis
MDSQSASRRAPRIVYVLTHPMSARCFLDGQLKYLRERGAEVTLITAPGPELDVVATREGIDVVAIPMEREISPARDLRSLWALYRALRRLRPDIVNAGTPKAGLLGMLAAWLARVPIRVYTLHGLRLETVENRALRGVLSLVERVTSLCASRVVCVSRSLREVYVEQKLAGRAKTAVLGAGSANGIDLGRFNASAHPSGRELRERFDIPPAAPVLGFVGRFTVDKGLRELFQMFERLLPKFPDLRLVLLGEFEAGDALPPALVQQICAHPQVIRPGYVADTAPFYPLFDVVMLPSYREGLPTVPLEAAGFGLAVVGFRTTGIVDAVQDGVGGMLVPRGDTAALTVATERYLSDANLRRKHGAQARDRVAREFRPERIWQALHELYAELLAKRNLPALAGTVTQSGPRIRNAA